jgi:hypothetical protein
MVQSLLKTAEETKRYDHIIGGMSMMQSLFEDQERPSGRWMTAPQWWVIENGCWIDSWLSAQV